MSLSSPNLSYVGIRDSILTLLKNNYSTLNTNLTKKFGATTLNRQILGGSPLVNNSPISLYPMIFVDYDRKNESYKTLGQRKIVTVSYTIYAIVREISNGGNSDDDEKMYLIDNIEGLLRNNITLNSSNANLLYIKIPETIFNISTAEYGLYVSGGIINLEIEMEVF